MSFTGDVPRLHGELKIFFTATQRPPIPNPLEAVEPTSSKLFGDLQERAAGKLFEVMRWILTFDPRHENVQSQKQ